ncbi:allophanate hydrolase [Kribbella sp. NPDC006257]|uniref:allophanate hydrolase n=1 Tax=Kribbella sp. NPDC006257 TaxID=3156738 RepID=UPI0033B96A0D
MTVWITRVPPTEARPGPLHGLTMAIKDNIDLAGVPTTAGDPRSTTPAAESAFVVERLVEAGAVPVGKTNLDQYATGLVGTRSPYGACHSVFSAEHISGGSSAGSAVAVASGEVDFALGTDTAGSGRVPAAFNGIVGIKPSKGLVSTSGVIPACRSLDCVTVFARDVATARRAFEVMAVYDPADPYARELPRVAAKGAPLIGVPDRPLGLDPLHERAWLEALDRAAEVGVVVPVDIGVLLETADLLYSGPWLAERWLAFGDKLDDDPAVDPTVRSIVRRGAGLTASETFAGFDRLAALTRQAQPLWTRIDALLLPVTESHPTLAEVAADPVGVNNRMGRFTNMVNLLDLCAIAFPGPAREDGLPFGVQLLAPAGHDDLVIDLAATWLGEAVEERTPDGILLAVAGAHLSGEPLNHELVRRGARLAFTSRTARDYRMFVVEGPRPGVTRTLEPTDGPGVEVEVWRLPPAALADFLTTVTPPLAIGPLDLADGRQVLGFLCTADAADPSREITAAGSWRNHLAPTRAAAGTGVVPGWWNAGESAVSRATGCG